MPENERIELPWANENLAPGQIWKYYQGFLQEHLHKLDFIVLQLLMAADVPEGEADWRENPLATNKPAVWNDIMNRLANPLIPGGPAKPAEVLKDYTWGSKPAYPLIPA